LSRCLTAKLLRDEAEHDVGQDLPAVGRNAFVIGARQLHRVRLDLRSARAIRQESDLRLRFLGPANFDLDLRGRGLRFLAALGIDDPGLDDQVAQLLCDRRQAIGGEARQRRLHLRAVGAVVHLAKSDHARFRRHDRRKCSCQVRVRVCLDDKRRVDRDRRERSARIFAFG
jgi:hypothetical protein